MRRHVYGCTNATIPRFAPTFIEIGTYARDGGDLPKYSRIGYVVVDNNYAQL
jgi:hypothetical protein